MKEHNTKHTCDGCGKQGDESLKLGRVQVTISSFVSGLPRFDVCNDCCLKLTKTQDRPNLGATARCLEEVVHNHIRGVCA